ncbi:MAG: response regulator [Kiritimatiellia bacterium]
MIRVIIIDDHPLVRDGMCAMLSTERDFKVVGTAEDGNAALSLCRREGAPDLAIVDVRMPGMDGFQTLHALKAYAPKIKVLMLAGMPLKSELARAEQAGASGYLPKSAPSAEIVAAARAAVSGRGFLRRGEAVLPDNDLLSRRETQVLVGINDGLTREQIAEALHISVETVKTYAKSIMVKLGAPSSAAAVGKAHELGILGKRT